MSIDADRLIDNQTAPRKAKTLLHQLLASRQITPAGLAYAFLALDPFHDHEINALGMPTGENTRTLVKCIRRTYTIRKPTGLTAGATYDARLDFTPLTEAWYSTQPAGYLTPMSYLNPGRAGSLAVATTKLHPGLSVNIFPTSQRNTWITSPTVEAPADLSLPNETWPQRIVAAAFEVNDITPELYKGGSVMVYRVPTVSDYRCDFVADTPTRVESMVKFASGFPTVYSNIASDPSTLTMPAAKGVYHVMTRHNVQLTDFDTWTPGPAYIGAEPPNVAQTLLFGSPIPGNPATEDLRLSNINCSGAWFGGLNENAVLQVTVKYYTEDVIGVNNANFPLTRLSPVRDNLALELVSQAVRNMPVGVPVDENPLGEWFNDLMKSIAEWAPTAAAFIPGIGPAIGAGISGAATTARSVNQYLQRNEVAQQNQAKAKASQTAKPAQAQPNAAARSRSKSRGRSRTRRSQSAGPGSGGMVVKNQPRFPDSLR